VCFVTKTKTKTNLIGKSPTTTSPSTSGPSTSPVTKMNRRRLRTTSRSGDDRVSFRGRNPIYTAGIHINKRLS
jgi:hypothetical protein